MRSQAGVTLIELIVSLVIFAIIATVGSLFFAVGVNGYLTSKRSAELAQSAQYAMDRIALELKNAEGLAAGQTVTLVANTSLTYECTPTALSGTRQLSFSGSSLSLTVDGTSYLLLEGMSSFGLTVTQGDIDGNSGSTEITRITVSFTLTGSSTNFTINVVPRTFIRL